MRDSVGPGPRLGGRDTEPLEWRLRPWSLQEGAEQRIPGRLARASAGVAVPPASRVGSSLSGSTAVGCGVVPVVVGAAADTEERDGGGSAERQCSGRAASPPWCARRPIMGTLRRSSAADARHDSAPHAVSSANGVGTCTLWRAQGSAQRNPWQRRKDWHGRKNCHVQVPVPSPCNSAPNLPVPSRMRNGSAPKATVSHSLARPPAATRRRSRPRRSAPGWRGHLPGRRLERAMAAASYVVPKSWPSVDQPDRPALRHRHHRRQSPPVAARDTVRPRTRTRACSQGPGWQVSENSSPQRAQIRASGDARRHAPGHPEEDRESATGGSHEPRPNPCLRLQEPVVTAPSGSAGTAGRNYRMAPRPHSWQTAGLEYGRRATCAICGHERHTHGSTR